jgi:hypothetical protein
MERRPPRDPAPDVAPTPARRESAAPDPARADPARRDPAGSDPAARRAAPRPRPRLGRGGLGGYISPDGSAGRRRPLPAWLPEAPDPPVRGEESGVRLIPFDEVEATPPVSRREPPSNVRRARDDAVAEPQARADPSRTTRDEYHAPSDAPARALADEPRGLGDGDYHGVRMAAGPAHAREPVAPPPSPPPLSTRPRVRRVLGVNIDTGVAYLAVVETPDRVRLDAPDRIAPAAELETHVALADFAQRVARLLREQEIDAVGIVRPMRYANWRYAEAFARVSVETCIMLEASRQSLRFEWVGQQHASNVLGVPVERLSESLATRLGVERGATWSKRCPAMLVALAIASEAGVHT